MTQLDLFKQAPKDAGQVVAFPVDRRAMMVRATAHQLGTLDYIAGRKFWNAHVKALRTELRAVGIPCRKVDLEIRRYSAAVARTVNPSLLYQGGPDTAA
ncbi:DUF6074 family protein [Mesorhizobium sp. NZP2077]|uniref:DUF6074 family protein n=1 Tax=Mesorhizobium sp. NZP2077 TaxID=2483404 RepID=UPI001552EAC3|nr:DUF6074 family protein [Mesorhizobium sp. NZP2077]QKC84387.1 hypothetical protein EB232_24835 [Mesorhizobium sp. NZP2077]QKD17948.1 hypothetical protein HGP13_24535 [Mesorhizobium sp. NZP2077]